MLTLGNKEDQPGGAKLEAWRLQPELSGNVRQLTWGIGHTSAEWVKRWAAVYRGKLYLLQKPQDANPVQAVTFWSGR